MPAFETLKNDLSKYTLLSHPNPNAKISISTDASNLAIGAVLQQSNNNRQEPISFLSKKLCKAEQNYSTFDRELLAMYIAIRNFRFYLEGREFCIFTDHKPLTAALLSKTEKFPTTTYYLQSNGMIERFHRQLKASFNSCSNAKDWYNNLPWVLLEIRSVIKEDMVFSSSQILTEKL